MADNNQSQGTPSPSTAIPMGAKYHWWYDSRATGGANNSPPTNLTGRTGSIDYSTLSQSPPAGGEMNAAGKRRDSLKNMVHLSDFATP